MPRKFMTGLVGHFILDQNIIWCLPAVLMHVSMMVSRSGPCQGLECSPKFHPSFDCERRRPLLLVVMMPPKPPLLLLLLLLMAPKPPLLLLLVALKPPLLLLFTASHQVKFKKAVNHGTSAITSDATCHLAPDQSTLPDVLSI